MLHFKSGVQDRMATCEIVGESQLALKIHERITFLDICPRENNIGSNMELTRRDQNENTRKECGIKKAHAGPHIYQLSCM